jgi:hypothetical protein
MDLQYVFGRLIALSLLAPQNIFFLRFTQRFAGAQTCRSIAAAKYTKVAISFICVHQYNQGQECIGSL